MTPEPDTIHEQLERILSSETFATAARHSRLLRYLVDRTLAGEGEQLKEYVLGTEVFDRPDSYDPRLDSIVRVEVRRLRSRLEEYYRGVGGIDPIVITIPRGSYVPLFEPRHENVSDRAAAEGTTAAVATTMVARATAGVSALPSPDERRSYSPAIMVAAALSTAAVLLAVGLAFNANRGPAQAATGPGIAVLPFEHYSTREEDTLIVAQLTDTVTAELAKLGTVSVRSRTSAARYAGRGESVTEIAKALNADFVIEAGVTFSGNHLRVVARLVDGRLDRKVWVGEYEVEASNLTDAAREMAAAAASAALR